ncbi:hypothetical protein [Bradyrhizobium sp.]|uniref:hypothetical protein n=1 Tax=Bradyrhizobium sp. TaxID=376 RepID=UPI002D238310|nr:hypothetical protein [Bradyrhizobium sp.]HZR76523.1 hypothetical protein [Bradyrhizobium sp.]
MSDYSNEIELFNDSVDEKASLACITRDSDLQRHAIAELSTLGLTVDDWKKRAIAEQDEHHANLFLGCECIIDALSAELKMWLQLKEDNPDAAWNSLVSAQMATRDAMRAHKGFSHLEHRAIRLVNIERVVFPKQVFLSAGLIVGRQQCSICNLEYEDCSHLVGKPYMGEFCRCILLDVKADHVAIVDEPANKQCRIVSFNTEGGKRNRMTWRVEPNEVDDATGSDRTGLITHGILLANSDMGGQRKRG